MVRRLVISLIALAAVYGHGLSQGVPTLVPLVLRVYPHDASAFTQGLLWHDGALYESTGLYGQSSLRRVDIETGESLVKIALADDVFAEGLELVDGRLIQLTWKAGLAFVYDLATLDLVDTFAYEGDGWGLCGDGRILYMSDGSSFLSLRDADTFKLIFRGAVTLDGQLIPAQLLNELECVGDFVYANAWYTDYIFRIDKLTGEVTAVIDASGLLEGAERASLGQDAVLNGIAYNSESETFYVTGKKWDKLFEVVFVEG